VRRLNTIASIVIHKAGDYARLVRLDRPIGLWLLLWPMLWGLVIAADGHPHQRIFVIFALGVLLTRSAGCALNDFADRRIDPHVARTRTRPLATGLVSAKEALCIYVLLSLSAFALVLQLDPYTIQLSLVGAGLTLVYPFLKRFFSMPQVWLGLAFSWSIPMVFAAETGHIGNTAWLLLIAALLWTTAFDTLYAMVDRGDDVQLGVRSTAILFGRADRIIIALLQLLTLTMLAVVGVRLNMGHWFYMGLLAGTSVFAWHQWLIRTRDPAACFQAFLGNHWFGLCVFVGIALDFLFRHSLS
jgi:4-hydroxybenzoate polyprenyltransferase